MINYRNSKNTSYLPFFRVIDEKFPRESYIPSQIFNCHDGQRKLLFSEIEFYNMVSLQYPLEECLVVYIGSGEGIHMSLIFDMFPQLDFILIDPTKSLCVHPYMKNKEKVIQINEYYTDESYKKILSYNTKNKKILFMSDIREEVTEEEVWKDMLQQQKWCIQLDSIAYLIKFRLPYIYESFDFNDFDYLLPLSKEKSIYQFDVKMKGIKYLKGRIYPQIYPPVKSTETRLIHIRKPNEPFTFYKYDPKLYEDQLFYFNTKCRLNSYQYKDSQSLKNHLLGYDDGYESVCEYYIIDQYLNSYCKRYNIMGIPFTNPIFHIIQKKKENSVIHLLYYINQENMRMTQKDLISCSFRTAIKKDKIPEELKDDRKITQINDFIEIIKGRYLNIILSMKSQVKHFQEGTILSKEEYMEEIMEMKRILKIINQYMKTILERKYVKKYVTYFLVKKIVDVDEADLFEYIKKKEVKIQPSMMTEMMKHEMMSPSLESYKKVINALEDIQKEKWMQDQQFV